ncbi:MAG: hypothetical protein ACE5IQ_06200 [Candidatus Methylomirabilales bacterium]
MSKRTVALCATLAMLATGLIMAPSAWAVPAFARAYGMSCSGCHTTWPALNATGRKFKENGYTFQRGKPKEMKNIGKLGNIPITFPWALVVKSRPYDKKENKDTKLRALHELEFFVAGNAWNYGSFFAEFEAEDEAGFDFELAHAVGGIHPHPLANIVLGKAQVFHVDPHDTLTNDRRLTRSKRQALAQGETTGVTLDSPVQMVSLYGRETVANKVFYALTYSADVKDDEGEGPKDWTGRLVVDVLPQVSVGGFITTGEQAKTVGAITRELDFKRYGFDVQAQIDGVNVLGAFVKAEDDLFAAGDEQNNLWYGEIYYTVDKKVLDSVGIPGVRIVPIFRFDQYEKMDGDQRFKEVTANISYYPWENVRVYTEFFKPLDAPSGTAKPWRWTVQVEFGF